MAATHADKSHPRSAASAALRFIDRSGLFGDTARYAPAAWCAYQRA